MINLTFVGTEKYEVETHHRMPHVYGEINRKFVRGQVYQVVCDREGINVYKRNVRVREMSTQGLALCFNEIKNIRGII